MNDALFGRKFLISESVVLITGEIFCYVALFMHLHKHDRDMVLIVPQENLQMRRRVNVVQLSGHVIRFITKMVWLWSGIVAAKFTVQTNIMTIQLVTWAVIYGVDGVFLCAISPKLRKIAMSKRND